MPRSNATKGLVCSPARPHRRQRGVKILKGSLLLLGLVVFLRFVLSPVGAAGAIWTTETSMPQALQEMTVTALNGKV
jgi:hypothetical protein